jgi:serine/threonine protein kinase
MAQCEEDGGDASSAGLSADPSTDVWSFGALIFELLEERPLIARGASAAELLEMYENVGGREMEHEVSRTFDFKTEDAKINALLARMFSIGSLERIKIGEVMQHPYLKLPSASALKAMSLFRQRYKLRQGIRRAESMIELGFDERTKRDVAIKWLPDEASWQRETASLRALAGSGVAPEFVERFVDRSARFAKFGSKQLHLKYGVVMEAGVESLTQWAKANPKSKDWKLIVAAIVRAVDVSFVFGAA